MIHKPAGIINEVSGFMSFETGDVLMTGTPKGESHIVSIH
jgi:2-keto-4-pentenoate hydratase/2-oxohepta-3-ene-1,7-dioic acid hydratase in catechol pathway